MHRCVLLDKSRLLSRPLRFLLRGANISFPNPLRLRPSTTIPNVRDPLSCHADRVLIPCLTKSKTEMRQGSISQVGSCAGRARCFSTARSMWNGFEEARGQRNRKGQERKHADPTASMSSTCTSSTNPASRGRESLSLPVSLTVFLCLCFCLHVTICFCAWHCIWVLAWLPACLCLRLHPWR